MCVQVCVWIISIKPSYLILKKFYQVNSNTIYRNVILKHKKQESVYNFKVLAYLPATQKTNL